MTNKTITLAEFSRIWLDYFASIFRRWWLSRIANHYEMCADVEHQRYVEAMLNYSFYQKKSALIRADIRKI